MIYVISATSTEFVKIGLARNPITRMRELQTAQPTLLVLLASADWPNISERRIHAVLRKHRTRGEWFTMNDDIGRLIKHMQAGDRGPKAWLTTLASPPRLARILSIAR